MSNISNNLKIFFNNSYHPNREFCKNITKKDRLFGIIGLLGEVCFLPIYYLFDGNDLSVHSSKGEITVYHFKTFSNSERNLLKLVASILLIVPGILIGSFCKSVSYISPKIRDLHQYALKHYTPIDHTLGTPNTRLNLREIMEQLIKIKITNEQFNQPIGNLSVFAYNDGTKDSEYIKACCSVLNPKKIIVDIA